MKLLNSRDFETTPAQYAKFIHTQISWAKGILVQPAQAWQNGSSHVLARQMIDECTVAYANLVLEHGQFYANGSFAGFSNNTMSVGSDEVES